MTPSVPPIHGREEAKEPVGRNVGYGLIKVRDGGGVYYHQPSGRYIIQTDGWEGPKGGHRRYWEHAIKIGPSLVISSSDLFSTLREAFQAAERLVIQLSEQEGK